MSKFDKGVDAARRVRRARSLFIFCTLAGFFLTASVVMLVLRAVPVLTMPTEANASVSLENGFGFIFANKAITFSDSARIVAEAPLYQKAIHELQPSDFGRKLTLTLQPLPAKVSLKVRPSESVTWLINDSFHSEGAALDVELTEGSYRVQALHPKYQPLGIELNLSKGEIVERELNFRKAVVAVALRGPLGSEVRINGQSYVEEFVGNLPAGNYEVRVSAPGYQSLTEVLAVTSETQRIERNYRLDLKEVTMIPSLSPAGGKLTVNGLQIRGDRAAELPHSPSFKVTYRKEGFITQSRNVKPKPGDRISLEFALKPSLGKVRFESQPTAQVVIDGVVKGQTPLVLELQTLETNVKLEAKSFRSESRTFLPVQGQTTLVSASLMREADARLREASPVYTNSRGSEFRLVQPRGRKIKLGGYRSETGQRANEYIREVVLKKPFYVATTELTQSAFSGGDNLPLVNRDWADVAIYCNELSTAEGFKPVYKVRAGRVVGFDASANGYRLITEAEWEYMSRFHGKKKGTTFVWGNDAIIPEGTGNLAGEEARGQLAQFIPQFLDKHPSISAPGIYLSGPSGWFDFVGNVHEWVHDLYQIAPPRQGEVFVDPMGLQGAGARTLKGSSYKSASLSELRAAYRDGASEPNEALGFRLARYL